MTAAIAYTLPDAARVVGLSERFLRDAITAGDLAARYAGRKVLIPADELRAWVDAMPSQRPTPKP